ncbi:IclR family transcriptional regulator [Piscinibacter sp.]|uniref:IclR family transcriptional regulator n=1 Tax=Piscinibacter sp. TaxID=1903157 RepID=UPI0039E3B0C6
MHAHSGTSASRAAGTSPVLVPALSRALTLLDRLAQRREPMSLARLASELDLPKSSVHGLCSTLLRYGYLQRQDDGAFRIGPGVMPLADAFVSSTGITQEFNALWAEGAPDETVVLSVLNGRDVVYIGARNGQRPLGLAFNVGMRLPAHLAATGKAMLAFQAPAAVRERFAGAPLAAMTGRGARSVGALLTELARTRARGHSIDDEGVRDGVYCIGAPVFDASGTPVAGLGVCIHKTTLAGGDGAHRDAVLRAARTLTQRLGGRVPAAMEG